MKVNEKLLQTGINPDTADFSDIWAVLDKPDSFTTKKDEIGTELAMLLSYSNVSRAELAEKTGWLKSAISRFLSGTSNLTLRTIFDICQATGYEFDITFRKKSQAKSLQPWQRIEIVQNGTGFNNVFNIKSDTVSTTKKQVRTVAICSANDTQWFNSNISGKTA